MVKDTSIPVITADPPNPYTLEASTIPYADLTVNVYDVADPNVSILLIQVK